MKNTKRQLWMGFLLLGLLISILFYKGFYGIIIKIIFVVIIIGIIIVIFDILKIINDTNKYYQESERMSEEYKEFYEKFFENGNNYQYYQKRTFKGFENEEEYQENEFDKNITKQDIELSNALKFFGFRKIQEVNPNKLKKQYRDLIKKAHPDNGGSIQQTQEVNKNYKILEKQFKK